ncbi:hypothetical protein DID88_003246 [Monilinia fructigena]|uniref:Uncharacterized protein n=1 Tax=Monilinia fructigena TaxID=38457 RepID=A0A395IWG6_9HELO|nr:hypothetical protein DID88_003246 [Monilinia fructigena]
MNILGLRRHFNSPLSFTNADALATSPSNSSSQDSQDNKDVLLQRLNDLVVRLSHDDAEDAAITALHKKADEMETLLKVEYSMDLDPKVSPKKVKPPPRRRDSNEMFWGRPLAPTRTSYLRRPSSPSPRAHSTSYDKTVVAVAKAAEIATSAEELNVRLAKAVGEIQASRIESEKILAWHVSKLGICSQRDHYFRRAHFESPGRAGNQSIATQPDPNRDANDGSQTRESSGGYQLERGLG